MTVQHSPVDQAKAFDCPTCLVDAGQECWPREITDANWVHAARTTVMQMNPRVTLLGVR